MWRYFQSSGDLAHANGFIEAVGYSGHGDGINNPAMQNIPDVGPIPQGLWSIAVPKDTPDHGPFVLPLYPHDGTDTFGRDGFLIHGDEVAHAGERLASRGCIVLSRGAREEIWTSGDHILRVEP